MPRDTDERTRLDVEMDQRRVMLGLRWEHIADKARISTTYLRKIRRGDVVASALVIAGLEDALQWQHGSIDAVLRGDKPALTPDSPHRDPNKTLGEMLLDRGLARPEDLGVSDNITNDPVAWEIVEMEELSEESRNRFLRMYAYMRREIFETARNEARRTRT